MRYALAVVFVLHGLIHFLGASSQLRPGSVPQLSGRTLIALPPLVSGISWAVAGALFIAAAVLLVLGQGEWWRVAAVAAVVSQVMVLVAWPEAKAGTVANVIAVVAVVLAAAMARFEAKAAAEVAALLARVPAGPAAVVTKAEVDALPAPIARWLDAAGVIGRPRATVVRLTQTGELRMAKDAAWLPATAEQVFTVVEPGFVWTTRVTMAKVLPVLGRDLYAGGRGHMRVTLAGLVPVVDATGATIDEGTLQRWLGELVWFPSAALSPHIQWAAIDERQAKATLEYGGVRGEGVFTIDERGRFVSMEALRFLGGGPEARRERWLVPATAWRRFDGVEVPVEGEVTWRLADGDFTYYRWRITSLVEGEGARTPLPPLRAASGLTAARAP